MLLPVEIVKVPSAPSTLAAVVASAPLVKRCVHWPPTSALPHPDVLTLVNVSSTRTACARVGVGVAVAVAVAVSVAVAVTVNVLVAVGVLIGVLVAV